ncbi:MAG TPA: NAD(P)H-dependent oxidoreductase subunit E [archaeon]|nr:NAD(P)H-dependent oxidoreductase subunit E [archaeon]
MEDLDAKALSEEIKAIAATEGNRRTRLINVVRKVQHSYGQISSLMIDLIAEAFGIPRIEVDGVVSFYHFLRWEKAGRYPIYLNNSVVSEMMGSDQVAAAFEEAAGVKFGETTADGLISLAATSCIGMSDQEPAALIGNVPFTSLTPDKAHRIVNGLRAGKTPQQLVDESGYGDGNNANPLVRSEVKNNLRKKGQVLFSQMKRGAAIHKAVSMKPEEVIERVKVSKLRGRGGAGFPTGLKWDFCRRAAGERHYVFCNADEGEPGTFTDRVLLTENPNLVFEGMTIAGYAIGSHRGILYLRQEYEYLMRFLEDVLEKRRADGLLGKNVAGKTGFDFDIRIQPGAGAYICGEESAMINSTEGKRGEPRDRPPFPVQDGYLGKPTLVNNVETLAAAARIVEMGGEWFSAIGSEFSTGTKLLSISGDCKRPGVYELPTGIPLRMILSVVGNEEAQAVVVGGPSGTIISEKDFDRKICYDDLPTGGALIIIGPQRDLLKVVYNFIRFFEDESCGWCVPCRVGTILMKRKLEKILQGQGTRKDLQELEEWSKIIKSSSRCGLGQTAPNPVLTTINTFRAVYAKHIKEDEYLTGFDLESAVADACEATGRNPNLD